MVSEIEHKSLNRFSKKADIEDGGVETAVIDSLLTTGENKYRGLFEATPVSLWEEDFSEVKLFIDQLRQQGVTDFRAYFDTHPEAVTHCISLIKVNDVNQATLKLFKAKNKDEVLNNLDKIFGTESFDLVKEELIRIERGETSFQFEGINYTLENEKLDVLVRLSIVPGFEETLSQVIISVLDITSQKRAENQLRLQATALESVANAIVISDNKGDILWVNPAFTKLTGYSYNEVLGKNPNILKSGKNSELFYQELWQTITAGKVWHGEELINRRKDGTFYHEQMTITPVMGDRGEITRYVAIKEDVSARKQMEMQLRRQVQEEELLRRVVSLTSSNNNLTEILTEICQELARFYQVPKAAFAMLNAARTQSEVITEYRESGFPSSMGAIIPLVGNSSSEYIIAHKKPLAIENVQHDPITASIHELMRQIGIKSMLIIPIMVGNEVVGTIGFDSFETRVFSAEDITLSERAAAHISHALERQQAAKALQRERDFAHQVMGNMGQGLMVLSTNMTIDYCNPSLAHLVGYDDLVLIGQPIFEIIRTDAQKELLFPNVDEHQSKRISREIDFTHANGTQIHVLITAVPRADNFEEKGAICVVTDLSAQKKIENALSQARDQAVEASRLKSEFLANMSHEIRTPLNAVIGMTSLMLDSSLTGEQQEYAQTIRSSGEVLLSLINDILDFSKIEAGKLDLEKRPFSIRDCVEEALDVVVTKASEKELELAYIMDDAVPPHILGDVTRVRQILVNLLNNAIKFTDNGEVVLYVSRNELEELTDASENNILQFSVKDTGIGILPERLDRLFKSFSQIDASTTRKHGGTGLGLAISKQLVRLMGGRIWVDSTFKKGSTFHFTIAALPVTVEPRINMQKLQPDLEGKRLLIVDDNQTNCKILEKQAEKWGMKPKTVLSGAAALDLLQEGEPFDLAILDMQMPEMDGMILAGEIQKLRNKQTLPLVMLSSIGGREDVKGDAHFSAFLTKPVKQQLLFETLMDVFSDTAVHTIRAPKQIKIDPNMAKNYPLRILLAEDNLVNQKVALRILERMGYRADIAGDGVEVLEALQRQPYDVVLMDVQMPIMDGVEATEQIRDIWPPAEQPDVIAMTAHALTGDREKYLAAGMDNYISKPVRIQE
ncbi:MAG: response regulator, partial [Chloroflexi bacterium]|nr:response regulator [Chloroflexota bacterium]